MGKYLFATSTGEGHSCLVQECYVQIHQSTLNLFNRWTQQLDGLYPLRYFFWTWHCQHALVSIVHIPFHAIRVQHV
jgi:hypothetical protein